MLHPELERRMESDVLYTDESRGEQRQIGNVARSSKPVADIELNFAKVHPPPAMSPLPLAPGQEMPFRGS